MIISLNWLKKYVDIDMSIDDISTLIGERLVEIESVEYIGDKYRDVIVAKVIECSPLEGTDHLNVVMIDDGGAVKGIDRDSQGFVQVVCGAPNVSVGALVAWLPPKATVPETYGDAEPFVLETKSLRGVLSNGMLASAKELDLYDDHSGILLLDKEVQPGDSFRDSYELDDYLFDIENKSLTHRPDAFGIIGFAREIAGIQGKQFTTPAWLDEVVKLTTESKGPAPTVVIDNEALSDRFQAVILENISGSAYSPVEMQTYLARSGVRPVNATVDIANMVMLLTGQPSHTYDYDKVLAIAAGQDAIHVRLAREDEKLTLLDGKEINLDKDDIVIAAGDTAVGLAGVMGGASTSIDTSTKRVLLEVATFDLYRIRSTQMRHGIFSEAVTRFTKGIPSPLGGPALAEIVRLFEQYTGARVMSGVADEYPGIKNPIVIDVDIQRVNDILGTQLMREDITMLLENVGFTVKLNDLKAEVSVPYWREDIHIVEDIIEEIGRLIGFGTINVTLPSRYMTAVKPAPMSILQSTIRKALARAGANEVLTYSFVHEDVITRAGQDPKNSYKIVNSISPDLQRYRQSLTPSLLGLVHPNIKAGYDTFGIFEINKVHGVSAGLNSEGVPVESQRVAAIFVSNDTASPFYVAKRYVEYIANILGLSLSYANLEGDDPMYAPFEPKRSAIIFDDSGSAVGVVGEYRKAVRTSGKIAENVAGFELDAEALLLATQNTKIVSYRPLSRYPATHRDICFQVPLATPYATIVNTVYDTLSGYDYSVTVEPVDIYRPEQSDTKNVTIRLAIVSYNKTLVSDEVSDVLELVVSRVTALTRGKVI